MKTSASNYLDSRIYSLASNLFATNPQQREKQDSKEIIAPLQKAVKPQRVEVICPAIIGEAFALTMDNYRLYISSYNFRIEQENILIANHNSQVAAFVNQNQLSIVQTEFKKLFELKYNALNPKEYNEQVELFCNDYGLIVQKKKMQGIKYPTELVFQNLLHLYNSQLLQSNEKYQKGGVTVHRPIAPFKVNSYQVTQLKRNGVDSLPICTKTVRNHRKRLQEAGVFVEYHFAGRTRAVELHINPEILVVFDLQTQKFLTAYNKEINGQKSSLKQPKNKNSCSEKASSTTPQEQTTTTAENTEKTLSDRLKELIIHPQELAQGLTDGVYHNYKPIDIRYLYKEAFAGTLTNEEFRELVIQDFFKSASKLYRNATPYVGSWKKAIMLYYQNRWLAFTGNAFNKSVMIDEISQMRWRLNWALKWFTKYDFTPLFPYQYFDMTRQSNKEVGFEYTKTKYKEHLQGQTKYENLKKKQQSEAIRRKESINYAKKCEDLINRFFKDKLTYTQLYDSIKKNLPSEYLQKLPELLSKKALQYAHKIPPRVTYYKMDL